MKLKRKMLKVLVFKVDNENAIEFNNGVKFNNAFEFNNAIQ